MLREKEMKMQDLQTTQCDSPLDLIVDWSKDLPSWQQDALRRIIEAGDVSAADIDELVELCLASNGVEESELTPKAILAGQLPKRGSQSVVVTLVSISDVENANALDSKQQLTFGESGLTVVFGKMAQAKADTDAFFVARADLAARVPRFFQTC